MKIVVSAPGKIHLMGEHAVVYGKPAVLAAVNLRLYATVERTSGNDHQIITSEPDVYARHAIETVISKLGIKNTPKVKLTIKSEIPPGYHLGSSAATAVSVVGAVMYFYRQVFNPAAINQLAYEVEKKMHGNPSGGDNTTCTMGGFIWFRKELEFLKSIWQLPFKLPQKLEHFFLIDTGRPLENTGEMVAKVMSKVKSQKSKLEQFLYANEIQTKRIVTAIKEENEPDLIDAIKKGQKTLEAIGVVSQKVCPSIREVEDSGGAAKILGGGGIKGPVGFLLCYHHQPEKIEKMMKPYGYKIKLIKLGEDGVRIEKKL